MHILVWHGSSPTCHIDVFGVVSRFQVGPSRFGSTWDVTITEKHLLPNRGMGENLLSGVFNDSRALLCLCFGRRWPGTLCRQRSKLSQAHACQRLVRVMDAHNEFHFRMQSVGIDEVVICLRPHSIAQTWVNVEGNSAGKMMTPWAEKRRKMYWDREVCKRGTYVNNQEKRKEE